MQTKTYFASSVPAALEVARKELGADAMLVSSRPSPADVRAFGRLEVTFAFDPRPAQLPTPHLISQSAATNPGIGPATARHSLSELDDIRQQISALRDAVGNTRRTATFGDHFTAALDQRSATNEPFITRLCANGLEPETARDLVAAASEAPGDMRQALVRELSARIRVTPFGEMKSGESRTLAFIGPAGRGKTTSLVKIAVRCGIARRVPVRIYSAGAHGIGGQEQMARYASILGVPFHAFESLESLHLALNGEGWKGLVLIDTPGLSRAEGSEMASLASFFTRRAEIEKHLVLRADARTADIVHTVSTFSSLAPSRLLFTGLDEALTLGAMVEVLARTGIPAAFAGTGQQIPDDMEDANASKWAGTVCPANPLAAAVAA